MTDAVQSSTAPDADAVITTVRDRLARIVQDEIEQALGRLPDVSEADRLTIETLAHHIMDDLLESPLESLHDSDDAHRRDLAEAMRTLFELE